VVLPRAEPSPERAGTDNVDDARAPPGAASEWLVGGGELGARVREKDWSSASIGPRSRWPQALRSAVALVVESAAPTALLWGPERVVFYNDACRSGLGDAHPAALGRPARELGPELSRIGELGAAVIAGAEALSACGDGTTRERAETAPVDQQASLSGFYDSAPFIMGIAELEGDRIVMISGNRAAGEFLATQPEDLVGRALTTFGTPEDVERLWVANYQRCRTDRSPVRFDYEFPHRSGLRRLRASVAFIGMGPSDKPRFSFVVEDVTEQRQAEEALEKMRFVLGEGERVAHLGSFEYVAETRTTIWSEEEYRIYGLDPSRPSPEYDEMLAKCIHPDDAAMLHDAFSRAMESASPYELEHRIVRPDGSIRVVHDRAQPHLDEHGKLVRYVGATLDITERKQAEDALREANARLVELDRSKDDFIAVLSHELRNPLAPLRSGVDILERVPQGSEPARRALEIIARQVNHLTRLVNDLLEVTRITRGGIELKREPLDLCELAGACVDDYIAQFAAAGVELVVRYGSSGACVNGDRTRLTQVLGNLLQNAAKFTPRGGTTSVAVEADASSGRALLRVHDTGRGIAPEVLPRLFEPFTQAETSLDRSRGGLGLGLAVAKGLVELHGGTISAESSAGRGTTFTVALPIDGGASAHARASNASASGRRVLLVEDNADAAELLHDLLELEGHEVEIASTGLEALAKARSFRPEIVFCDIGLPEMNGYEVARALRAAPELGRPTLVALSGYATPEDVARGKDAGFDAHVAKPPDLQVLCATIARCPR
jgi:PAS domain S-box-containing protein